MFDSEPTSLDQNLQQPQSTSLRVHDVVISGNTRTKVSIIERHLRSVREAGTVGELTLALEDARDGLERLGFFWSVRVLGDAGPAELNINIMVEELIDGRSCTSRPYFQGPTSCVTCHVAHWNACTSAHQPHILGSEFHLQAGISDGCKSYAHHSSHVQYHSGGSISPSHTEGRGVRYDLAWGTNTVTPGASPVIHKQAVPSLLSAVLEALFREGFSWMYNVPLAGIGLSRKLPTSLKKEVSLQYTLPLPCLNATLRCTACAGRLLPTSTSHIEDRFFPGGPNGIRGFNLFVESTRAWDPKSGQAERDSIGGNSFASLTTELTFDLPFHLTDRFGLHGHVFACAENVGWLDRMERLRSNFNGYLKDNWESTRGSVGAGIVLPVNVLGGQLEANITYALHKLQSDKAAEAKFGFQFGYGNSQR